MTRVAVLIGGEPRFCREFDLFLERLVNYDQVDWYMTLWDRTSAVSDYHRSQGSSLVSPSWQQPQMPWARDKILSLLPPGHQLVSLKLRDQSQLTFPEPGRHDGVTNIGNAWKMFWTNQQTDLDRRAHELQQGFSYDLVIKARPDVMLHQPLDLGSVAAQVRGRDRTVVMPRNTRAGYGYAVSDLLALGSGPAMQIYAGCLDSLGLYLEQGRIFHPETMLGWYLESQGVSLATMPIDIDIRCLGHRDQQGVYVSDFGRWL